MSHYITRSVANDWARDSASFGRSCTVLADTCFLSFFFIHWASQSRTKLHKNRSNRRRHGNTTRCGRPDENNRFTLVSLRPETCQVSFSLFPFLSRALLISLYFFVLLPLSVYFFNAFLALFLHFSSFRLSPSFSLFMTRVCTAFFSLVRLSFFPRLFWSNSAFLQSFSTPVRFSLTKYVHRNSAFPPLLVYFF